MNRYLIFVLLLATTVALAKDKPKVRQAASATDAEKKTEIAKAGAEHAPPVAEKTDAPNDEAQASEDPKLVSVPGGKALGMSILGNQDAPKSLVIVPWKSSELGDNPGISAMLDDSRQPVDKEVFMRALRYYEIRSGTKQ